MSDILSIGGNRIKVMINGFPVIMSIGKQEPVGPDAPGDSPVIYYGTATELSATRRGLAETTVGNYALFGGGSTSSGNSSTVDKYSAE